MSEESIGNITKSDRKFAPTLVDRHLLPDINFKGHYLIKSNISIREKMINLYSSGTLYPQLKNFNALSNFKLILRFYIR